MGVKRKKKKKVKFCQTLTRLIKISERSSTQRYFAMTLSSDKDQIEKRLNNGLK